MPTIDRFEVDGVTCSQSLQDPTQFYYEAGSPGPELDAMNRPALMLLVSSSGAILQLGSHWGASADQLESLRKAIFARHPDLDPSAIRLSAASASVQSVALSLGDGQGNFETLQTSPSSGFPPFAALFNAKLTADQKDQAVAALNGRSGFLRVVYSILRSAEVGAEVRISGDVKSAATALAPDASAEDCRGWIVSGIENGTLKVEKSETGPAPPELTEKARVQAIEKAAAALRSLISQAPPQPDTWDLRVSAALTDTLVSPADLVSDISSWFPGGAGPDHVKGVGGSIGDPVTKPTPVAPADQTAAFDFDDRTDLPLAFVEVAQGKAKAVLRPPAFEAVPWTGDASGDTTITTNYTDGGGPFQTVIAPPGLNGRRLGLADLGLQRVTIDATARNDAGAHEVRIRVQYRPTGNGTSDDRTIYLRNNNWKEAFYIVTRDSGIAGSLGFDWKETAADGSASNGRLETANPDLKL